MARTITVFGPAGLASPTVRLVTAADAIAETISLTEATNAEGKYTGTISAAGAGDYTALLRSGTSVLGTFEKVTLTGVDPEAPVVRDFVTGSFTASIDAGEVGEAVWSALLSAYNVNGTFGRALQQATAFTVPSTNLITIIRDNTYDGVANAKLSWTVAKDYTGGAWSGTFTVRHRESDAELLSATVTVVNATTLEVTLTGTETALATITNDEDWGTHPYEVQMSNSGSVISEVQGQALLKRDYTT